MEIRVAEVGTEALYLKLYNPKWPPDCVNLPSISGLKTC